MRADAYEALEWLSLPKGTQKVRGASQAQAPLPYPTRAVAAPTYRHRVYQKNACLKHEATPEVRVLPQRVLHRDLVAPRVPNFVTGGDKEVVVDLKSGDAWVVG